MPPSTTKGLYPALLAVQAEAPTLQKTAINPHFKSKFVPLDVVTEAVMPILNKHGLVWLTLPAYDTERGPVLQYRLIHVESGEELNDSMLLLAKPDPQGQGSGITYARRYALMAVLGLVADEDDDGNKASEKPKNVHDKASFEKKLADEVAALPGTVEMANAEQLEKLDKARLAVGAKKFDTHLRAQGADNPGELTKELAETVLTWARANKKAAA